MGQRLGTTGPPRWHLLLPHCPTSLLTTLPHEKLPPAARAHVLWTMLQVRAIKLACMCVCLFVSVWGCNPRSFRAGVKFPHNKPLSITTHTDHISTTDTLLELKRCHVTMFVYVWRYQGSKRCVDTSRSCGKCIFSMFIASKYDLIYCALQTQNPKHGLPLSFFSVKDLYYIIFVS